MFRSRQGLSLLSCVVVAASACTSTPTTHDQQTMRMDQTRASFGTYYRHMSDNAILRDMSLADIHFVAHTAEINGIGEVRLERMARLLSAYGGTVRYEARERDAALVEKRVKHAREYLALVGCDMDRVDVVVMRSGGRGGSGDEAVQAFRAGHGTAAESVGTSDTGQLSGLLGESGGR